MKTKINLFPLVVVSWIMVFYLLITHNLSWYLWLFIGFVVLERTMVQLGLWLQAQVIKVMAQQQMKLMEMAHQREEGFGPQPPM